MNKQELVRELSGTLDISQKSCREALDVLLEEILQILEEGKQYSQTGFGSFRTELANERICYNPAIRKKMIVPKKQKIKFRASEKLKDYIND